MKNFFPRRIVPSALVLSALLAFPLGARASRYSIRENSVLAVVFRESLTIDKSRAGDQFRARFEPSRGLPRGTEIQGRVLAVRHAEESHPGYLDVEFTDLLFPDGTHMAVSAFPISQGQPAGDDYRDRLYAVPPKGKKELDVLGGAVAGFALGSIFKKQAEGTILGTIAGIAVAESDKSARPDVVVAKGQKLSLRFDQSVSFDYRPRRDDRYGSTDEVAPGRSDREERPIQIRNGEKALRFVRDEQPFRLGDVTMVPLERTAAQLGVSVEMSRSRFIYLDGDHGTIRIEKGRSEFRFNGETRTLSYEVTERNGVVYAPVEVFNPLLKDALSVEEGRNTGL